MEARNTTQVNNLMSDTRPKEAITQSLVMRQLDTNSLKSEVVKVSAQAARVHTQMASIDDESAGAATAAAANVGELTRESLDALKHLRSYQQALVNLYIDGRIDIDKFITHMQAAHASF